MQTELIAQVQYVFRPGHHASAAGLLTAMLGTALVERDREDVWEKFLVPRPKQQSYLHQTVSLHQLLRPMSVSPLAPPFQVCINHHEDMIGPTENLDCNVVKY